MSDLKSACYPAALGGIEVSEKSVARSCLLPGF
jgi:hypothetical protein